MKASAFFDCLSSWHFLLSLLTTVLAFLVVIVGAYTRLTDAGLGCPDWPLCYGHWTPTSLLPSKPPIQMTKAWTEMFHRYLAGTLGLLIMSLTFLAIYQRSLSKRSLRLPLLLLALVIFQGLLGKWTVTLKLLPIVVMTHLLGGLTTLSLLWWYTLTLKPVQKTYFYSARLKKLQHWALIGMSVLLIQLFLGGWTSANYAALICLDFPFCSAHQSYKLDFLQAFNFISAGISGIQGEFLNNDARITIHMLHRFHAIPTTLVLGWLAWLTFLNACHPLMRKLSGLMIGVLILQICLGITNVLALLPLPIALAHNGIAALLLLIVVTLNYYVHATLNDTLTTQKYAQFCPI